jgi:hypothetical protein
MATMLATVVPTAFAADAVMMQRPTAFNEDADIPGAVKKECKLEEQLPDFVAQFGKEKGLTFEMVPQVETNHAGRVLDLQIYEAVADGNAFMGHHKSVSVKGKLYQDGKVVASFKARRNSMGGAFGGFKGNCSVLGRSVEAIGEDIAGWLAAPKMDALLGDLE